MKKTQKKQVMYLSALLGGILFFGFISEALAFGPRPLPETLGTSPPTMTHLDEDSTLSWDNGTATYYFSYPDLDDDSLFNVRFKAPTDSTSELLGAWFMLFDDDGFYTAPYFVPLVWNMDTDSFPNELIGSDTIAWAEIDTFYPGWYYVDLSHLGIGFEPDEWFHIGFTGILEEPEDTVAIISDDGNPPTQYSSFMWRGQWYTMEYLFSVGYNLFIRAVVNVHDLGIQVLEPGGVPSAFHLDAPYPNPFNPTAILRFSMTSNEPMRLTVTDVLGRTVATLAQGRMAPGVYRVTIDGRDWPSGFYFANLLQGSNHQTVRLILTK